MSENDDIDDGAQAQQSLTEQLQLKLHNGAKLFRKNPPASEQQFLNLATDWCLKRGIMLVPHNHDFKIQVCDEGWQGIFDYTFTIRTRDGLVIDDYSRHQIVIPMTKHSRPSILSHALAMRHGLNSLLMRIPVPHKQDDLDCLAHDDIKIDMKSVCNSGAESIKRKNILMATLTIVPTLPELGWWRRNNKPLIDMLWKTEKSEIWAAVRAKETALRETARAFDGKGKKQQDTDSFKRSLEATAALITSEKHNG